MIFEVGDTVQVRPSEPWFAGATGTIADVYPEAGVFMVALEPQARAPHGLTLPFTSDEIDKRSDA